MPASRWEKIVWPQWLPATARMPLVAQITGAVSLTALLVGPWWASIPASTVVAALPHALTASPVPFAAPVRPVAPGLRPFPADSPAHLNLDVRHSAGKIDLSITVDGKRALETTLEGSGRRFGVFGKRAERGFTRTLMLNPGVHLVGVRVRSSADNFDHTRVERFDLAAASVAALRISADKSGLLMVAERPPAPPKPAPITRPSPAPTPVAVPATLPAAPQAPAQQAGSMIDLLLSLRSMLIAIAGFVGSAATGFVVQEYLRTRKSLHFAAGGPGDQGKRRRAGFAG
jgi:hypothetical protein